MQASEPEALPDPAGTLPLATDLVIQNAVTLVVGLVVLGVAFLLIGMLVRRIFLTLEKLESLKPGWPLFAALRKNIRALLALLFLVSALGFAGYDGWLWYEGEDLLAWGRARLEEMPEGFWLAQGLGVGKVIGLVIAAFVVLRPVDRLLLALTERAKDFDGIRANDERVEASAAPSRP